MKKMISDNMDLHEERFIRAAIDGDTDAYGELVKIHQRGVYRLIRRFTRNHEDTNDLVQETFLKAYRSLGSFRQGSKLFTWLYRIAVNQVYTYFQKKKRERTGSDDYEDIPGHSTPETVVSGREGADELNRAVKDLPEKLRMAVELVYIQGLSHQEVGDILGCSEKTVSWRVFQAKKVLKKRLHGMKGVL